MRHFCGIHIEPEVGIASPIRGRQVYVTHGPGLGKETNKILHLNATHVHISLSDHSELFIFQYYIVGKFC